MSNTTTPDIHYGLRDRRLDPEAPSVMVNYERFKEMILAVNYPDTRNFQAMVMVNIPPEDKPHVALGNMVYIDGLTRLYIHGERESGIARPDIPSFDNLIRNLWVPFADKVWTQITVQFTTESVTTAEDVQTTRRVVIFTVNRLLVDLSKPTGQVANSFPVPILEYKYYQNIDHHHILREVFGIAKSTNTN
jgi:hypothetical protein